MAAYDFTLPRLKVEGPISLGTPIMLEPDQVNYLLNVLRLRDGATVHAFDGASGEFRATLARSGKRGATLSPVEQVRDQTAPGDLWLLFAPLKAARLDYMVQKAVEMGASRLVPVITRYTQVHRLNGERLLANVIEACEQCGVLSVPDADALMPLDAALARLGPERRIVFCDEDAPVADPIAALSTLGRGPLAVLIGPEGGFAPEERRMLLGRAGTAVLSLGPRILRADTAAVAALALVQAVIGDTVNGGR